MIIAAKHFTNKNQFLKISDSGPYFVGFHAMQIMDLWTMLYHPAKVPAMYFSLSLDSTWAHCGTECEATFELNRDLESHMNTVHLKIKPYKCDVCELCFAIKKTLNNHVNSVHLNHRGLSKI